MRIVLIGSGNVATVMGRKFYKAGHVILQVYSKNRQHADLLAKELRAEGISMVAEIDKEAEIYIVAIPDDELYRLDEWMFTGAGMIAHTAGSVSIDVLRNFSRQYGAIYPLQSLKKDVGVNSAIPLLVDGNSKETVAALSEFAKSVSDNVHYANDDTRRKLHLGAVIVNNFPNYLYTLTEQYCRTEGVDFKLLAPLIAEGALRSGSYSPHLLQTGPASRNDRTTMQKHCELLGQYPALLELYRLFSEFISSGRLHS